MKATTDKVKKQTGKVVTAKEKFVTTNDRVVTTREAAEYLGMEYTLFLRARNVGYIGADKYPTPRFINIGIGSKGIRYKLSELDKWLADYPTHATPALFFKDAGYKGRNKKEPRETGMEYGYGR